MYYSERADSPKKWPIPESATSKSPLLAIKNLTGVSSKDFGIINVHVLSSINDKIHNNPDNCAAHHMVSRIPNLRFAQIGLQILEILKLGIREIMW